ncbi:hypothetical protein V5799_030911 [Amblyomma americanum]|uniref:Secreted protein n=1 Tax=Amblyomma americanum TaxID=6943 RepID=A0AAQ4ELT7_AMBAM
MNAITSAICVLGLFFFTASAETSVEEEKTLEVVSGIQSKIAADEAVLVGHILRNVAHELQQDAELDSEYKRGVVYMRKQKQGVTATRLFKRHDEDNLGCILRSLLRCSVGV